MNKILNRIVVATLTFTFLFSATALAKTEPVINAETAILVEGTTGKIIFSKDMDKKMFPASMTKILTALITLDHFDYDALITVGDEINDISYDSSKAGHKRGETLSVQNLIRGLMIPSGNDSAAVLAAAVAKKTKNNQNLPYDESEKIFAEMMNEKVKSLGGNNSNFTNPHGYHDENHYSTAHDMALISAEALKDDVIKKIVSEKEFIGNGAENTLESPSSLKSQDYNWKSHNLLITASEFAYPYANGIKTGFTDEAGDCVSASAEKDDKQLIAVIFKSEDPNRWTDATTLFNYGFDNYNFKFIQKSGDIVDTVQLNNHNRLNGDTLEVVIKDDIKDFITDEDESKIVKDIVYNSDLTAVNKDETDKSIKLKAPIAKDTEVGAISYKIDNTVIKEVKIFASKDVEEKTFINSAKFFFKNIFIELFTIKGLIIAAVTIIALALIIFIINKIRQRRSRSKYKYKIKRRR